MIRIYFWIINVLETFGTMIRHIFPTHNRKQERLARDTHSGLFGAFVTYKEKDVNTTPLAVVQEFFLPGVLHEDEVVLEPVDRGLGLGGNQA
jgi:hypothetical protein